MNKIVSALLALYLASFLYLELPFIKTLPFNHIFALPILFIGLFFILNKVINVDSGRGAGKSIKLVVYAVAFIGLLIDILYHLAPIKPLYTLPGILDPFFASDIALTLWLVVPLIALVF